MTTEPTFISATVEDITQRRKYTKAELCPMDGWPDGVDPYPEASDDQVVLVTSGAVTTRLTARATPSGVRAGDTVAFGGSTFLVESVSHISHCAGEDPFCDIVAVSQAPIPSVEDFRARMCKLPLAPPPGPC